VVEEMVQGAAEAPLLRVRRPVVRRPVEAEEEEAEPVLHQLYHPHPRLRFLLSIFA
jgi:hypothetical protein